MSAGRAAVQDRLAHRDHGVLALLAPEHVGRHRAGGEQRVDHEAVPGVDDLLFPQVDDHDTAADAAAAPELVDERRRLLVVELHPFPHVRQLQDLVDAVVLAGLDQLHHQLVVRDPEVAEAPQPGAAVHQEVEQHPAGGREHLLQRVLGRVGLVDGPHQLRRDLREPLRPAVVVVDHPGRRGRVGVDDVVGGDGGVANGLAAVMVEHEMGVRRVGEVGGDVAGPDLHLPVLHVLGMDEQDVADQPELLEQHGTHQPIEVTPGDQPVSLHRRTQPPCQPASCLFRNWSVACFGP